MPKSSVYSLPKLLSGQYMLTAVMRESADTVTFAAMQKDLRREVVLESLRPECMADPFKVQRFLEMARAQSSMGGKFVGTVLELLYAEDTWHIARERIQGRPLDELLAQGERGSAATLCEFMLTLCRICIKHDMLGIATAPFSIQNAHYMGLGFRLANLAQAGPREPSSSCRDIRNAARDLLAVVDAAAPRADDFIIILRNILSSQHWHATTVLDVYADLVRLQLLLTR